ncbi:MAG TPA: TlyA family RNA methyltransferase [Blastocatellia bacterium]|nr:TlyA family RNA methyltransferase [Blastocatellia bacterium]
MKERIDKLLVDRGLVESREKARALVLAGQVLANEQRIDKPGQTVALDATLRIKGETLRYVGRGGLKLEAALAEFGIDPTGMTWIDVGASTGGFTDCLLQRGAERVWAVDVGHNQLDYRIRTDPRVEVREGVNARSLAPEDYPRLFDGAVVDVSFISLKLILPAVARVVRPGGIVVALVKPQFEVGRGEVGKGGIVRDDAQRERVRDEIIAFAETNGMTALGSIESPVPGAEGNREYLVSLRVNDA